MKNILLASILVVSLGAAAQQNTNSPDSSRNAYRGAGGIRADYVAAANAIIRSKGSVEKERLYKDLTVTYANWRKTLAPAAQDIPTTEVAYSLITDGDTALANKYIDKLTDVNSRPSAFYGFANVAIRAKQFVYAENLLKRAIDAFEQMTIIPDPKGDPLSLMNNPKKYGSLFYNAYAEVLTSNGKTVEALKITKKAYDFDKTDKSTVANYARSLLNSKKNTEAIPVLEEAIRAGSANEALKNSYKELYVAKNGMRKYESRLSSLMSEQLSQSIEAVKKLMVSEPSPMFSLQDLSGKTWSLANLKGKIVILDFWATWCAPCKKSFPAMQLAVNKYKDDKSVVFLFIHTWEREQNPVEMAAKYIGDNKFDFNVLMDLKKNGSNEVITSFKATGIPAKFVIDGQGNIRFKLTGFSGGDASAVAELSAMIELAKNS